MLEVIKQLNQSVVNVLEDKLRWGSRLSLFLAVVLCSLGIMHFLMPADFPPQLYNVMLLVLLAVGFWITDAFPPFAVSMFVVAYSVYFLEDFSLMSGVSHNWEMYADTWASPVIWIMMGGFFISLGISLTGLDRRIASFSIKMFGTKPSIFLLGTMLLTVLFSVAISNTATAALMIAVVTPLLVRLDKKEPFTRSLVLGVAFAASFGGLTTIPGSPVNALAADMIHSQNQNITYVEWLRAGMPLCLFFTAIAWLLLMWFFKPKIKEIPLLNDDEEDALPKRISKKEWFVIIVLLITVSLWLTSSTTGIPVAAVSFVPMMALTISGIIKQQHIRLISWDTLLLVAGALTLGIAAQNTGLLNYAAGKLNLPDSRFMALLMMCYITVLVSNFMSSTAAASILIPLANTLIPGNVVLVSAATAMCCSMGILFPISTPPNAIALSTGYIKQKDFRIVGLFAVLAGPVIICYVLRWWIGV